MGVVIRVAHSSVTKQQVTIPERPGSLSGADGPAPGYGPNPDTPSTRQEDQQQAAARTSIFGLGGSWEAYLDGIRSILQAFRKQCSC